MNKILIILFIVFNTSCRYKDTTIQGQVRTYGTQRLIEHPPVTVRLVEKEYRSSSLLSGGYSYKLIAEQQMNSNGNFSFRQELDKRKEYFLAVKRETVKPDFNYFKPNESLYDQDYEFNQVPSIGGSRNVNLYLKARGWVKFEISRSTVVPLVHYSIDLSGSEEINFGSDNTATIISPNVGGHLHKYHYRFYNSDTSFSNYGEVYVLPLDTVTEEIVFN